MVKYNHLIGVKELQDVVKLVVASGFLKEHKPLSLILVGKVGSGKTDIISSFSCKNVHLLTDLSSTGVYDLINDEKLATHIIIPDFTKITMKNKSTSNNLLTTLNSVMEEGLGKVRLKNTKLDFKGKHLGIITATTKASYMQNQKKFKDFGFDSRFLIASYGYSQETILNIMESIYNCDYLQKQYKAIPIKKTNGDNFKKESIKLSYDLAKQLDKLKENAFRTQKQLQTLVCCQALISGRKEVIQEDIDEVLRLNKFFNLKFTEI